MALLGGPILSLVLAFWTTCRIKVVKQSQSVVFSVVIARTIGRVSLLATALLLTGLLLGYAFVENFRIVFR